MLQEVNDAVERLDLQKWRQTSAKERLRLLKRIQERLIEYSAKLSDTSNLKLGLGSQEEIYQHEIAAHRNITIGPVASNISACIRLYEYYIKHKHWLKAKRITKVEGSDAYDLEVFPYFFSDRIVYQERRDVLRVKGEPVQVNPMDKEGGILAVLGAGNYCSSYEIIRALFIDNYVVVHKPHEINQEADFIWAEVFQPLVDHHALSFVEAVKGKVIISHPKVDKIYFTGGLARAETIRNNSNAEFVGESGGNNPCIIMPGQWTDEEIEHQALHIATFSKLMGGANCARLQTIVTCKNWPQRQQFIKALRTAFSQLVPDFTTFYPGTVEKYWEFKKEATLYDEYCAESGAGHHTKLLFVEDVGGNEFFIENEAFCQVVSEVALDVEHDIETFAQVCVDYCNTRLLGTLACGIMLSKSTESSYRNVLDHMVSELRYGAISINTMPAYIWLNPYLTWGGNEEEQAYVSGNGNFGNLLSYENVEKSIAKTNCVSLGHICLKNKQTWVEVLRCLDSYALQPTFRNVRLLVSAVLKNKKAKRDF